MEWTLLGFKGLTALFNVHPAFVHFPIALLPASLLFYFIGIVRKQSSFLFAGRFCLYLALPAAIITVWTGLDAQDSFPHTQEIQEMIETHEKIGITVLVIAFLLVLWSFFRNEKGPRSRFVFLIVMGFASLLVLQNADIGSRMVFLKGAAVKPFVRVMEKEIHAEQHNQEGTHENE